MNEDEALWQELAKTIRPLSDKKKAESLKASLPPRLRVRRAPMPELSYTLDLHGLTLEAAYSALKRFLKLHQTRESKQVTVITGKGLLSPGAIKNEIGLWLDTPAFQDTIRSYSWKHGGGALTLQLKKRKK